jgi:hypothetical protein
LETVRLVDLDGSAASAGCNLPRARKEFDRFLRDLERAEKSVHLHNRVLEAWQKALM